jgi:hypothetical protein
MVDTCKFNYAEEGKNLGDKIIKILLAAMDKGLDNDEGDTDDSLEEKKEDDDPYKKLYEE